MGTATGEPENPENWGILERIKRRRLRNYLFLDKKLQFNIAILLAVIGGVNAFYFSLLFYFYSQESLFRVAQWIPDYVLEQVLNEQFSLWSRTIVFVIFFEITAVILLGLFFSHRIAGPLYAMSQKLKDVAKGRLPPAIRLRKNDLLTDFAETMNEAFSKMAEQRSELEAALSDANSGNLEGVKSRLRKLTTETTESEAPSNAA